MSDARAPHTPPEDYEKLGLGFERDNAAVPEHRGEPSP